ncbi:MAG: hypothetical protein KAT15_26475 [Bacteroidales bacterium]|nr:hypothetical protein [Bacteroidales bacterium]
MQHKAAFERLYPELGQHLNIITFRQKVVPNSISGIRESLTLREAIKQNRIFLNFQARQYPIAKEEIMELIVGIEMELGLD